MKIRLKILITILPIMVITVLVVNLFLGRFFNDYLIGQEKSKITGDFNKIKEYLMQKEEMYLNTAKDWGHWTETYNFIQNVNEAYITNNLEPVNFSTLDVQFMLFFDNSRNLVFNRFYDNDSNHTNLPEGFLNDINNIADAALLKETAATVKLGNSFYFIAEADVTDSNRTKEAIGKIYIGRKIDESIVKEIEDSSDCTLTAIKYLLVDANTKESGRIYLDESSITKDENKIAYNIGVKNENFGNTGVIFSLSVQRDLYNEGMQQLWRYIIANIIILLLSFFVLFILLRLFITKPLISITNELKDIHLGKNSRNRLNEKGNYELKFLRQSINTMLEAIETEQSKVKSSEEKLFATLFSVGDGVIAVDRQSRIEFINPVAEKLMGWKMEEAKGQPMENVFRIVNEYTKETVENPATLVFEQERIVALANHTLLVARDGSEIPIEDTAAPIRDKHGRIVGCVLVFRDFSERKERQRRIEYLSYHDQLTGLYNRRFFNEELKRLDKKRNLPISLIYADVNGLKMINDAFGHQNGDKLISTVAGSFKTECRADDIIARVGGDEFVMILPKTDWLSAERVANRIKDKISKKKIIGIPVSTAFGWDTKTDENQSIRDVLKNAENQMYKKKIMERASKKKPVIRIILDTLKIRAPKEAAHSQNVGILCGEIGRAFGLSADEIIELKTAGELHDIGKIVIDEAILNKTEKLTETEWKVIKSHPEISYRLLSNSREYYGLADFVLAHHERWDGNGYPKGIRGNAINWKSRIIAVADAYDAMTSPRPYHKGLNGEEAIAELKRNAGKQFDPEIVKVFIEKVLNAGVVKLQ